MRSIRPRVLGFFVCMFSMAALSLNAVASSSSVTFGDIRWGNPTRYTLRNANRITVRVPQDEKSTSLFGVTGTIPADKIGDAMALRATVRARGASIAKPNISWLGLKFQFRLFDAMTGMARHPNTHTVRYGSFDWREIEVFAEKVDAVFVSTGENLDHNVCAIAGFGRNILEERFFEILIPTHLGHIVRDNVRVEIRMQTARRHPHHRIVPDVPMRPNARNVCLRLHRPNKAFVHSIFTGMVIRLADCHTPDALTYQSFIIDVALSRLKAKMHISARPIAEASVLDHKAHRKLILRNPVIPGERDLFGGVVPE